MGRLGRWTRRGWDRGRPVPAIDRGRLLALLTPRTMARVAADVTGAAAIAFVLSVWIRPQGYRDTWWLELLGLVFIAAFAAWEGVRFFRRLVDWYPTGRAGRTLRLVGAALVLAAVIWWVAAVGAGAAWASVTDAVVSTLPAIFVLVFGVWAVLLVRRRVARSRHRFLRGPPDVMFMAVFGVFLVFMFDRATLLTRPVAGLLIPVGVWASVRTWQAMSRSPHLAVNAAADIVLSLLLGTAMVLSLVWVANLVGLPRPAVATIRSVLDRIGSIVDVPWWVWVVGYLLLATAGVLATLWPARSGAPTEESGPARVLPFVNASRRVLSGLHIGLMLTVLIAVAAPPGLESTLRHQIKVRYTVAVQRVLADQATQSAYERIRQQFTAGSAQSVRPQPLTDMLEKIHSISRPAHRGDNATDTERSLARRLGQAQAGTFHHGPPPPAPPSDATVSAAADLDRPIRDADDLTDRLDRLDSRQQQEDQGNVQLERAAEAAAVAVASVLQLPDFGSNEILQVVKEYLSGVVESSPLKEVFAAWARRAVADAVPPADQMVVPDPRRIRIAAEVMLIEVHLKVRVADPFAPDQARDRTSTEADIAAAVDLANEARFLTERRGPCAGCPRPLRPGEDPFQRPGEPGREERPRPPEIHVR
jgi:hypothetical protein